MSAKIRKCQQKTYRNRGHLYVTFAHQTSGKSIRNIDLNKLFNSDSVLQLALNIKLKDSTINAMLSIFNC